MPSLKRTWAPGLTSGFEKTGVRLDPRPDQGFISLQLSRRTEAARAGVEAVFGPLPDLVGTVSGADVKLACVGPRAWMALSAKDDVAGLLETLSDKDIPVGSVSALDVSERAAAFTLSGPRATDLLERTLGTDPSSIPVGSVTRTVWNGNAILVQRAGGDSYLLAVDIALGWALADWLNGLSL